MLAKHCSSCWEYISEPNIQSSFPYSAYSLRNIWNMKSVHKIFPVTTTLWLHFLWFEWIIIIDSGNSFWIKVLYYQQFRISLFPSPSPHACLLLLSLSPILLFVYLNCKNIFTYATFFSSLACFKLQLNSVPSMETVFYTSSRMKGGSFGGVSQWILLAGTWLNYTSLFPVRLLAAITSWEAPSRKITVVSAAEMGPPAGWSEGSISPSSPQPNVRLYRDGPASGFAGWLASSCLALALSAAGE